MTLHLELNSAVENGSKTLTLDSSLLWSETAENSEFVGDYFVFTLGPLFS